MVVNDVVFVLLDDFHSAQNVECVVHTPLHVLEIDFLTVLSSRVRDSKTYWTKLLVDFENLVCDLRACDHRLVSHFLEH